MPNYQGVWSLSEQYQNRTGWPDATAELGLFVGLSGANTINKVDIASSGNAIDFGDMLSAAGQRGTCATKYSAIAGGGGSNINNIESFSFTTSGTAADFGDLTVGRTELSGFNSATRGIFIGGDNGSYNDTIDYITMNTAGNAIDFGNLTTGTAAGGGCSNSTRGLFNKWWSRKHNPVHHDCKRR